MSAQQIRELSARKSRSIVIIIIVLLCFVIVNLDGRIGWYPWAGQLRRVHGWPAACVIRSRTTGPYFPSRWPLLSVEPLDPPRSVLFVNYTGGVAPSPRTETEVVRRAIVVNFVAAIVVTVGGLYIYWWFFRHFHLDVLRFSLACQLAVVSAVATLMSVCRTDIGLYLDNISHFAHVVVWCCVGAFWFWCFHLSFYREKSN